MLTEQQEMTGAIVETKPDFVQTDQTEHNVSCQKYERLANLRLRNSDTIILGGYGCFIKVNNGSFVVEYQRPHEPGVNKLLKLNRGFGSLFVFSVEKKVYTKHLGGFM